MAANEQKSLSVTEWTKKIGRIGGKARLTKMTAEERSRIARLAARARWGKKTAAPDPNPPDPQGPGRDKQWAESGIMSTPRRRPVVGVPSNNAPVRSRAHAA